MASSDFDALALTLTRLAPLGEATLLALRAISAQRSIPRAGFLLRAGEQAESVYFLVSGLVREFYCDDQGAEHTRRFVREGELSGSLLDLLSLQPAVTYIQALEPTSVLTFSYARFDALCARHSDLQLVARRMIEHLYLCKTQREHAMLALSAEQRLAQWQGEYGAIDPRISRRHLASYLGITPEHLSRLRRAAVKRPARPRRTALPR